MAASSMEGLATELAEQRIGSVFIYTHEAHPGENYPHHTSFEQKLNHAKAFQEVFGITRPILVDRLDGACHRAYGGMPNMSWILDRAGRPIYKADWTDVDSIRAMLDNLQRSISRRREQQVMMHSFQVARLEYRFKDDEAFNQRLADNGPRAVTEYNAQMQRWKRK